MDSCYDVLILHHEPSQDPLSLEAVSHHGTAYPVCFCCGLFSILLSMDARGGNMEKLRCDLHPGL